jgi:hypothetical protein
MNNNINKIIFCDNSDTESNSNISPVIIEKENFNVEENSEKNDNSTNSSNISKLTNTPYISNSILENKPQQYKNLSIDTEIKYIKYDNKKIYQLTNSENIDILNDIIDHIKDLYKQNEMLKLKINDAINVNNTSPYNVTHTDFNNYQNKKKRCNIL